MIKKIGLGCERFTPDPGTHEKICCGVCGEWMEVKRDQIGARGWAEAIGSHLSGEKSQSKFDLFECKNCSEDWHKQAKELIRLAIISPSGWQTKNLLNEAKWIINHKQCTNEKLPETLNEI